MLRLWSAVKTPRGALLTIAVVAIVGGVIGMVVVLPSPAGTPRLAFDDIAGSPSQTRVNVLASTENGAVSTSLAPGLGGEAAVGLADAPLYFLSAYADIDIEAAPAMLEEFSVTEQVVFKNTSDVKLTDARLRVVGEVAGSELELLEVGGAGDSATLRGSSMIVELSSPLEPGEEAVLDLSFRVRPPALAQPGDIGDIITDPGTGGDFGTVALTRANLVYMLDWYPRLERLGPDGWVVASTDDEARDFSGPAGVVQFDIDLPDDWFISAGGTMLRDETARGRTKQRYVLAGSRALPFVAMRNGVEVDESIGEFRASGLSLDTFGFTLTDATRQALYAQAVLSDEFASNMWRDTAIVGLALGAGSDTIVADNMVLIDQDLLAKAVPNGAAGASGAEYRTHVFEGVAAQWWGGRTDIDADALPAYDEGLRQWSSALVWRRIGDDPLMRIATSNDIAKQYRSARDGGIADMPASLRHGDYESSQAIELAAAKVALAQPAVALELAGTSDFGLAYESVGRDALRELVSEMFGDIDEAALIDAYTQASGIDAETVRSILSSWLTESSGDAQIGSTNGAGSIPEFTDTSSAADELPSRPWIANFRTVKGFGPGW